jgi:hypothetical protein
LSFHSLSPNAKLLTKSLMDVLAVTLGASVSTVKKDEEATSGDGASKWCRWASSLIMPVSAFLLDHAGVCLSPCGALSPALLPSAGWLFCHPERIQSKSSD